MSHGHIFWGDVMFTKVKGTMDLLPEDAKKTAVLENYLRSVAELYGFQEIRVPILSDSGLIHRSSGESSDIVTKETFDFKDRGERLLTLRPEGTAPVIRAVIENKMYTDNLPLKLFYMGDMFRYERPQKGRYREFSQFGVEVVGTNSPLMDSEVITLASTIFKTLDITNYRVRLNTLGDTESRNNYRQALKEYFSDKLDSLCADCKKRYEINPLRILDCKADKDTDALKNAPKISDFLTEESKKEFEEGKKYLDLLNIPYIVDESLVRGLDYYTNTIFEIELADSNGVGQSSTICAGGRYNNLTETLGGPALGCVGFAFGLERLKDIVNLQGDFKKSVLCQLVPLGDDARENMIGLLQTLRLNGFVSELSYEAKNLKNHFRASEKNNARFVLIQGEQELINHMVQIKDQANNTQDVISEDDLINYLYKKIRCNHHCHSTGDCECGGNCHEN